MRQRITYILLGAVLALLFGAGTLGRTQAQDGAGPQSATPPESPILTDMKPGPPNVKMHVDEQGNVTLTSPNTVNDEPGEGQQVIDMTLGQSEETVTSGTLLLRAQSANTPEDGPMMQTAPPVGFSYYSAINPSYHVLEGRCPVCNSLHRVRSQMQGMMIACTECRCVFLLGTALDDPSVYHYEGDR